MEGETARCDWNSGFTLVETALVLAILGVLCSLGAMALELRPPGLSVLQEDLRMAIDQGRSLARALSAPVTVQLAAAEAAQDILPVRLPSCVKWGKPEEVPLPPGMADPVQADTLGYSHARVVITHRGTATAATWFLNDGRDVICMRLSGEARLTMLRWNAKRGLWERK